MRVLFRNCFSRSLDTRPRDRPATMNGRTAIGMAGFVVLGLSPSFVDWQQSPEKRRAMIAFYVVALALIYLGVFRT